MKKLGDMKMTKHFYIQKGCPRALHEVQRPLHRRRGPERFGQDREHVGLRLRSGFNFTNILRAAFSFLSAAFL
jgi:hypothetical protein